QVADQVALLLLRQLQSENEVEELDGIVEGQQPAVVQIRRAVLDAAQREGLRRSAVGHLTAVDDLVLVVKALHLQVVHEVVAEDRRRVTLRAAAVAEEDLLASKLLLGSELGIQPPERIELRRG